MDLSGDIAGSQVAALFLTPVHLLSLKLSGFISLHFKVKSLVPGLREGSACSEAGLHGL